MQKRRFTKDFEAEAVRLVQTSGRTQREVAEANYYSAIEAIDMVA